MYLRRRELLAAAIAAGVIAAAGPAARAAESAPAPGTLMPTPTLKYDTNANYSMTDKPNSYDEITHYNNFYEFGLGKTDPAEYSQGFKPTPWSVTIGGE